MSQAQQQKQEGFKISTSIFGGEWKDIKEGWFNFPTFTDYNTQKTTPTCWVPPAEELTDYALRLAARLENLGKVPKNPFTPGTQEYETFELIKIQVDTLGLKSRPRQFKDSIMYNGKRNFYGCKPKIGAHICKNCIDPDLTCTQNEVKTESYTDSNGKTFDVLTLAHCPRAKPDLPWYITGIVYQTNREIIQEKREVAKKELAEIQQTTISVAADLKSQLKTLAQSQAPRMERKIVQRDRKITETDAPTRGPYRVIEEKETILVPLSDITDATPAPKVAPVWRLKTNKGSIPKPKEESTEESMEAEEKPKDDISVSEVDVQ